MDSQLRCVKALPAAALLSLATYFSFVLASLEIPLEWSIVTAILLPKVVRVSSLAKFRAIACLVTARKLFGYLLLQMMPPLSFLSLQTGFVPGSHPASGVFAINRAAELSREWGQSIYVVQLDLKKAVDRVKHSAILDALRLQGASLQCVAVVSKMLAQSRAAIRIGHTTSRIIDLARGLPQGAPESPLLFVLVVEMVLRPLLRKWQARGSGWRMDDFWLSAVCYADDVLLISSSKIDLEKMIAEVLAAFLGVGLEVGAEKSHWSSYPSMQDIKLQVGTARVQWESQLTYVGTVVSVGGGSGPAMELRTTQAQKAFFKWQPTLLNSSLPRSLRCRLAAQVIFSSLLWLCETWVPTAGQKQKMDSWGARLIARVARIRCNDNEDIGQYWRRLHRSGHDLLQLYGGAPNWRRSRTLHRFSGHLARSMDATLSAALHTRCIAWWRYRQERHLVAHPRRFKTWRWESQLTDYYGEAQTVNAYANVGWMLQAQQRNLWRDMEDVFAIFNSM